MSSVAVYCGSSAGRSPAYREMAVAVGASIAAAGHELVYGGGDVGLMGAVADAVLADGGAVCGIITEQLLDLEVGHRGVTELVVVGDMHERKAAMAARSDGVVVLPGGFGTLDETFEVLTWNQLGIHPGRPGGAVPVVLLDVEGYFAPLVEFVDGAVAAGFMKPEHGSMLHRVEDPANAVALAAGAAPSATPKWVDAPPASSR